MRNALTLTLAAAAALGAGALEAGHAIREDGSVVVRGAEEEDEEDHRD